MVTLVGVTTRVIEVILTVTSISVQFSTNLKKSEFKNGGKFFCWPKSQFFKFFLNDIILYKFFIRIIVVGSEV